MDDLLLSDSGILDSIVKAVESDRFTHIISGPIGVGKYSIALRIAVELILRNSSIIKDAEHMLAIEMMSVVSSQASLFDDFLGKQENLNRPDDVRKKIAAKTLVKIVGGLQSDVMIIDEIDELTVDVSSKIHEFAHKKSMESSVRVVIINNAHMLNHFAANSLLKLAEEGGVAIFFITNNLHSMLDTIRSRSFHSYIAPVSKNHLYEFMSKKQTFSQMSDFDKNSLIDYADGCPGRIVSLLESDAAMKVFLLLRDFFLMKSSLPFNKLIDEILSFPDAMIIVEMMLLNEIARKRNHYIINRSDEAIDGINALECVINTEEKIFGLFNEYREYKLDKRSVLIGGFCCISDFNH